MVGKIVGSVEGSADGCGTGALDGSGVGTPGSTVENLKDVTPNPAQV
jgi:hypothetical protein